MRVKWCRKFSVSFARHVSLHRGQVTVMRRAQKCQCRKGRLVSSIQPVSSAVLRTRSPAAFFRVACSLRTGLFVHTPLIYQGQRRDGPPSLPPPRAGPDGRTRTLSGPLGQLPDLLPPGSPDNSPGPADPHKTQVSSSAKQGERDRFAGSYEKSSKAGRRVSCRGPWIG